MQRIKMAVVAGLLALGAAPRIASAADTWLEMQSQHFTAISNGGEDSTRTVLWQFEQIRSAMAALWPWMKTDLAKPVLVIGEKDEATVRLLDRTDNYDQAQVALAKAAELGTSNAYAHYRAAMLAWPAGPQPNQETLKQIETGLARAVALNPSFADAYASLAQVRAARGRSPAAIMPAVVRAVQLEPSSPWHGFTEARMLWRFGNVTDGRKAAQIALRLADTDQERAEAERLLATIPAATAKQREP